MPISLVDVHISWHHLFNKIYTSILSLNVRGWHLLFSSPPYTVHCPNREPRQSGRLTPNKTETPLITQSRHYTNPYFHLSKWNRNSDSVLCWVGVTWPELYFSILAKMFPIYYGNFPYCYDGKLQELNHQIFKETVSFRVRKWKIAEIEWQSYVMPGPSALSKIFEHDQKILNWVKRFWNE